MEKRLILLVSWFIILVLIVVFILIWNWGWKVSFIIQAGQYNTVYKWSVALEKTMDSAENTVYIENNSGWYSDSLIIKEVYNQWKWALVFSQEAFDVLSQQELTIEDKKLEKLSVICKDKKQSAVLISYLIKDWLDTKIPRLYMADMFIEKDVNTLTVFSYASDDKSNQKKMIDAFYLVYCS